MSSIDGINGVNFNRHEDIDAGNIKENYDESIFSFNEEGDSITDIYSNTSTYEINAVPITALTPVKETKKFSDRANTVKQTFNGVEDGSFDGWAWKQNYIFSRALVSYYNGVEESIDYTKYIPTSKKVIPTSNQICLRKHNCKPDKML